MVAPAPCPPPERLRDLLDGRLPEPDQRQLVRHLDDCGNCQQALEGLAANAASWSEAARLLTPDGDARGPGITADLPPQNGIAKAVGADGETISLSFLAPPREAGHLGRLGHYEVLEVIGSGGFGVVLKAFDETLHRVVAIKVMAPQLAAVASARKRFSREARAAAAITNEHVVTIHAVEEEHDPPYLVMQYVAGVSLQERIDRTGPMQVKEILRIGMQAAQGLAAAHAQGLIHRDVKPANILLENGVERVKLTDFGLARMADDASVSQSGVIAGTPLYMAPEQARGEELDARADLFSLGSVLYAMCTGHPPFRAGSPLAVLRRVCEETPRPVRDVNPDVPDWLAEIVVKLHEKDRARRFQSAAEVAGLLEGHLAHLQHPATVPAPARLGPVRPSRRNVALGLVGAFVGIAVAVLAGALAQAAVGGDLPVRLVGSFVIGVGMGGMALMAGLLLLGARGALTKRAPGAAAGGAAPAAPRPAAARPPRVWTWAAGCLLLLGGFLLLLAGAWVLYRVRSTPSTMPAKRSATSGGATTTIAGHPRALPQAPTQLTLKARVSDLWAVAFSPNGNDLVAVGGSDADRPGGLDFWDGSLHHWQTTTLPLHGPIVPVPHGVRCVAFSPDGRHLATGEYDNTVSLRDPATGALRHLLPGRDAAVKGHTKLVTAVAFTPDSKGLVTASLDGTARLWDVATRKVLRTFPGDRGGVLCAAVAGDGETLVTGEQNGFIRRWDLRTGEEITHGQAPQMWAHAGPVESAAFAPEGRTLATGGRDGTVKLWDVTAGRSLASLPGPGASVATVAFSPDGSLLAAGGRGGVVKLWDVPTRTVVASLPPATGGNVHCVTFSPDGRTLAAAGWGDRVYLWDLGPPAAR